MILYFKVPEIENLRGTISASTFRGFNYGCLTLSGHVVRQNMLGECAIRVLTTRQPTSKDKQQGYQ
jgi:hypothetical protein